MKMKRKHIFLILLVASMIIIAGYFLFQSIFNPPREVVDNQLRLVETAISENEDTLAKLAFHEDRLLSVTGDPQLYRLPILVNGRSIYVTVDESGLEEVSKSLALEEIVTKHRRKVKGNYRSGIVAEWRSVLVESSTESRNHLVTAELPAIRKRMKDIRQETANLESRRIYLQEMRAKAGH
jgi:hypothetical protein